MNRQERRAAVKRYRKAMTTNGTQPQSAPDDMGTFREQLRQPEVAADLTVAETSEIKERKRLIDKQTEVVGDAQKMLRILQIEQQAFLQKLITGKGLSLADDYNLDSEGGLVLRTARAIAPDAMREVVPVVEGVAETVAEEAVGDLAEA